MPVAVVGGLRFVSISAGHRYTCAVTTGDAAYCWGDNWIGQLGNGRPGLGHPTPAPVTGGLTFRSLFTSLGLTTCGIATDGKTYCWGAIWELGLHAFTEVCLDTGDAQFVCGPRPAPLTDMLAIVDVGGYLTCGLTQVGAAYCWGDHGIPPNPWSWSPVPVPGGVSFARIAVGSHTVCGTTSGGTAYCWGDNQSGQQGTGDTSLRTDVPRPVSGGLTFESIAVGSSHTCGVTMTGAAYCWGSNYWGQLGNGTLTGSTVPVKVAGQP